MFTAKTFRRIALGLDGVIESAHMNHPDFRANGRIFATLQDNERRGMVTLSPEQQAQFVSEHPKMFTPENGAWGRQGCTRVNFADADEEIVGEAMTLAWQKVMAQKAPAKRSAKKTAAKKTAAKKRSRR
jgi:YjbR protein